MNKSELSKCLYNKLWKDYETILYDFNKHILKADINLFDAEISLYYIEPNGKPHKIERIEEYVDIIKAIINDEIITILRNNIHNATAEVIDDFATEVMYVKFDYKDWLKLSDLIKNWDECEEYNEQ